MRHNFPLRSVSNFYCLPECTIYRTSQEKDLGMEKGLDLRQVAGCLSDGGITSLNWNLKATRKEDAKSKYKLPQDQ